MSSPSSTPTAATATSAPTDLAAAADGTGAGMAPKKRKGAPTMCTFDRCEHPVAAGQIWCQQHVRIIHAGLHAIDEQWESHKSDDDIWTQMAAGNKSAVQMEALFAIHCYLASDPPSQVPMGRCICCRAFTISMHTKMHEDNPMDCCAKCLADDSARPYRYF